MKKYGKLALALVFAASITPPVYSQTFPAMTDSEYNQAQNAAIREEIGLVIENNPDLGYLVYVNNNGQEITRNYYKNQVRFEKQSYYEVEDLIGYINQMFPSFEFDPRETKAEQIQAGDYIYMHLTADGFISHVSASTNHIVRYGKVIQFSPGGMDLSTIVVEDEQGQIFHLDIHNQVAVSKAGIPINISQIQEGDWVKILVSQGNIGPGNVVEAVKEIVVDRGSRHISNIYRGQITHIDPYASNLYLQNTQAMNKNGWGPYTDIKTLSVDPRNSKSYHMGNQVSWDYVGRYLKHQAGYVYIAMEQYYGSERAIKLDFESMHQRTLAADTIISAQPGLITMMNGETIHVSSDTIIRRNGRLVDPYSIMPSDYAQVVVSGENKAAVIDITQRPSRGTLQVFRGRIKQIKDNETFEVETFSLLEDTLWMYHPIPRTFTIDHRTKFYDESGIIENGLEEFIGYGEDSQIDEVYTAIVEGDFAKEVIKMPYTRYPIRGEVYQAAANEIMIKNTYFYNLERKQWEIKSRKDSSQSISIADNVVVMKNGEIISPNSIKLGDKLKVMTDKAPYGEGPSEEIAGYLIIVE